MRIFKWGAVLCNCNCHSAISARL